MAVKLFVAAAVTLCCLETCTAGCCYSFGYGDGMKPCCLSTSTTDAAACQVETRMGGATGFTEDRCPGSADGAAALYKGSMAMQQVEQEQEGCCFSFGFGAMMKPCCLNAHSDVKKSSCAFQFNSVGGAKGFRVEGCPASAQEAASFVEDERQKASPAKAELPVQLAAGSTSVSSSMNPVGNEQPKTSATCGCICPSDVCLAIYACTQEQRETETSARCPEATKDVALRGATSKNGRPAAAGIGRVISTGKEEKKVVPTPHPPTENSVDLKVSNHASETAALSSPAASSSSSRLAQILIVSCVIAGLVIVGVVAGRKRCQRSSAHTPFLAAE